MDTYSWDQVKRDQMNPLLGRQAIHSERMTVSRVDMRKGCFVQEHSHYNEQLSTIETGRVKFILGGKEVILGPGQLLLIPPHLPHAAEALEDTIALDIFSPPREDWIRGDDAYLRK